MLTDLLLAGKNICDITDKECICQAQGIHYCSWFRFLKEKHGAVKNDKLEEWLNKNVN